MENLKPLDEVSQLMVFSQDLPEGTRLRALTYPDGRTALEQEIFGDQWDQLFKEVPLSVRKELTASLNGLASGGLELVGEVRRSSEEKLIGLQAKKSFSMPRIGPRRAMLVKQFFGLSLSEAK